MRMQGVNRTSTTNISKSNSLAIVMLAAREAFKYLAKALKGSKERPDQAVIINAQTFTDNDPARTDSMSSDSLSRSSSFSSSTDATDTTTRSNDGLQKFGSNCMSGRNYRWDVKTQKGFSNPIFFQ